MRTLFSCALLLLSATSFAQTETPKPADPKPADPKPADPAAPPADAKTYPRVGGHVGLAIPLVTFGGTGTADSATTIGDDFTKLGLAPGVTVKLSEHWFVDFEMVAYSNFTKGQPAASVVVDPGLIYNFGPLALGLRAAMHVGEKPNLGLIPIIVKGFAISDTVNWFIELDLPIFFNENVAALTIQPQTGVSF